MLTQRIGFLGAGRMATALGQGFLEAELTAAENLLGADPVPEARERFAQATGAATTDDNLEVAAVSDVIFLAVKPPQLGKLLDLLKGKIAASTLVVSIVAGVRLKVLAEGLGQGVRVVRVMPNTPCLVGRGASGYCLGAFATEEDGKLVEQLLTATGIAYRLDEKLLDAVTGLSGSGPAFALVIIEALRDGGVRMGLPPDVATALAAQTLRGAAEMVLTTGESPSELTDRVASPGGTTVAGLEVLESHGLREALVEAVRAATARSIELGAE